MVKKQKRDDSSMSHFIDHYSDTVVSMELFMDHTLPACQHTDALLNYYQVSYKRNQNIVYLDYFKHRFKDEYDWPGQEQRPGKYSFLQPDWPVLKVDISLEPAVFLTGMPAILSYLRDNGFILEESHKSNTAWAQQGIEYVDSQVVPVLETLFLSPVLTAENYFKSAPESYKSGGKSFILH